MHIYALTVQDVEEPVLYFKDYPSIENPLHLDKLSSQILGYYCRDGNSKRDIIKDLIYNGELEYEGSTYYIETITVID